MGCSFNPILCDTRGSFFSLHFLLVVAFLLLFSACNSVGCCCCCYRAPITHRWQYEIVRAFASNERLDSPKQPKQHIGHNKRSISNSLVKLNLWLNLKYDRFVVMILVLFFFSFFQWNVSLHSDLFSFNICYCHHRCCSANSHASHFRKITKSSSISILMIGYCCNLSASLLTMNDVSPTQHTLSAQICWFW